MEKIQERALKFIYEDQNSTYEELLEKSKLPSLKVRRIRIIAIETFKIINKQTPLYLHDLFQIKQNKYSFRQNIQHRKLKRWATRSVVFSGYPVSSTNKTDRHNRTELLLKVAFSTINLIITPLLSYMLQVSKHKALIYVLS
jgi:hypothetical protein